MVVKLSNTPALYRQPIFNNSFECTNYSFLPPFCDIQYTTLEEDEWNAWLNCLDVFNYFLRWLITGSIWNELNSLEDSHFQGHEMSEVGDTKVYVYCILLFFFFCKDDLYKNAGW